VPELALVACGCPFAIHCTDDETASLIQTNFGPLLAQPSVLAAAVGRYDIERSGTAGPFRVSDGRGSQLLADPDSLLFHLDKEVTLTVQRHRRDLFFLHAAAVAWKDRVAVLSAPPGTGKSTLTLVLLELGLDYLSDELAPVDLGRFTIHPYPRALCLKALPPAPHALPAGTIRHHGRFHVPIAAFANRVRREASPLAIYVFLRRDEERFSGLRRITAASATTHLMANALNLLAHPADGLDAAVTLGRAAPAFELDLSDLSAAGAAVRTALVAAEVS
jgi:hypothetical protein